MANIIEHENQERNMTTGRHVVAEISCRQCKKTIGWKYNAAYETSEKYKEGKCVLEMSLLVVL
jgi:hypothetical protein